MTVSAVLAVSDLDFDHDRDHLSDHTVDLGNFQSDLAVDTILDLVDAILGFVDAILGFAVDAILDLVDTILGLDPDSDTTLDHVHDHDAGRI